ncbi:bifunctional phosphoglucose/phosphomannose isomerase, partial [Candidatus Woesearchaeota archaeon]|nr:bifunctional phosphoglucose/phosphomannose isomerase [Candidatus Woesearchaeota archaeon]
MRSDVDKSNMYKDIERFSSEAKEAWEKAGGLKFSFNKLVIAGMGGSAIAGDLLNCFVSEIPILVNRDYKLPDYVSNECLVIVNSYSGNTEETLTAYEDAIKKNAQILVMASGGELMKRAKENNHPFIELHKGMQPRASLMYSFMPMVKIMLNSGIIKNVDYQVEETFQLLKDDSIRKQAEQLAEQTNDKIPLIYAPDSMYAVAMRWKTQVNENAKAHAFYNMFSEMNHNEIVGYTSNPKKYFAIFLRNEDDHPRIQKRFEICKELIQSDVHEVWSKGKSLLAKIC